MLCYCAPPHICGDIRVHTIDYIGGGGGDHALREQRGNFKLCTTTVNYYSTTGSKQLINYTVLVPNRQTVSVCLCVSAALTLRGVTAREQTAEQIDTETAGQ